MRDAAESQELADAQVDLVDAIAVHRAGRDRDSRSRSARCQTVPAERRRDRGLRHGVVRREHRARLALERRRELNLGLRQHVRRQAPELREDAVGHVAIRTERRHGGIRAVPRQTRSSRSSSSTTPAACARTSQLSETVWPVLVPPMKMKRSPRAAFNVTSMPLKYCVHSPYSTNRRRGCSPGRPCRGSTSYRPGDDVAAAARQARIERRHDAERRQVGWPRARGCPPRRNPRNHRRVYATSSADRAPICCWNETPRVQSDGRTPQPFSSAGIEVVRQHVLAEARVRHHAAQVAAGSRAGPARPGSAGRNRARSCGSRRSTRASRRPFRTTIVVCGIRSVGLVLA